MTCIQVDFDFNRSVVETPAPTQFLSIACAMFAGCHYGFWHATVRSLALYMLTISYDHYNKHMDTLLTWYNLLTSFELQSGKE